jgi:hypothetical protein
MLIANKPVVEFGQWHAVEMLMTHEKIGWLWKEMQKYRTLFSDLTRGDIENFTNLILLPDSVWLEVMTPDNQLVGIIYWTGLWKVTNVDVHIMFFDRKPAEKVELCKEVARWFFAENPQCNEMTATLPIIYHATIRLAKKIGFVRKDYMYSSVQMGGKLVDEIVLGLLATGV